MNKPYCLIIFLLPCTICCAQNLVPNPDFEQMIACPDYVAQIDRVVAWSSYSDGTPDYFNSCDSFVGVPANVWDYQEAHSGNAYVGIVTFSVGIFYREFIGSQLAHPLVIGKQYFVSFYANWVIYEWNLMTIAANKLGMRLSTVPYSLNNPVPIDGNAQLYTDSIVDDNDNWVKISGSFIADSAYTYLSIGNFFSDKSTYYVQNGGHFAYYFIEDVCLSPDSLTCNSPVGINEIENTAVINLFPNPFNDKLNITVKGNDLLELCLYDVAGRKIFMKSFTNSVSIDTKQSPGGIYFYSVRNKTGVIKRGKVVKE